LDPTTFPILPSAAPFRQAEFDIEYGVGISREGSLIDLGIDHDLVQKSGSFFSYGDTRLGQGRSNSKQFLIENPDIANEIEERILKAEGISRDGKPLEGTEPAEAGSDASKAVEEESVVPPEKQAA
jgi:recombination protein RecA